MFLLGVYFHLITPKASAESAGAAFGGGANSEAVLHSLRFCAKSRGVFYTRGAGTCDLFAC